MWRRSLMTELGHKQPIYDGRVMFAITPIVLQNSAAFCDWAGFEYW